MATVSKWTPFGVALNVTATGSNVVRKSATEFTVQINASWEVYWSGNQTNYGMTASSGGGSATLNPFGTKSSGSSKTFTGTYSVSGNGSTTKTITVTFRNFNNDNGDSATKDVTFNVTVPAWTSYTVTYNANGGTGAPSSQTKWHGQTLTLSSAKPTRSGYTFQGWALSKAEADAGTWYYQPGASCGRNENVTLYAVWKANTYTITYNANGGTGAPSSQTKQRDVPIALSSTKPTRSGYTFKGWATSASAAKANYAAGATYAVNSSITLYAVWDLAYTKPRIDNLVISRCGQDGAASDSGTYALVTFDWACDKTVSSVTIEWKDSAGTTKTSTVAASGTSGSVSKIIGSGALDVEKSYSVRILVQDTMDYSYATGSIGNIKFPIDVLAGGKGAAFNKAAELEGVLDIAFKTRLLGGIVPVVLEKGTDLNTVTTPGFYAGLDVTTSEYENCPLTKNSFTMNVYAAGGGTQIVQRIEACNREKPLKYERHYYSSAWYKWTRLSPTNLSDTLHHTPAASNVMEYVGVVEIPPCSFFTITARGMFNTNSCKAVIIGDSETNYQYTYAAAFNEDLAIHFPSCTYSGCNDYDETLKLHIWGKWAGTGNNTVQIRGFYIPY